MKFLSSLTLIIFSLAQWAQLPAEPLQSDEPVVRAVIFYSPNCGHCHKVLTEDLPPLIETYQEQLFLLAINVQEPVGSQLFHAAADASGMPQEGRGVPMLYVGETVLSGSIEIPEEFPGIVAQGLAAGGIDWPAIPGLIDLLVTQGLIDPDEPAQTDPTEQVSATPAAIAETDTQTTAANPENSPEDPINPALPVQNGETGETDLQPAITRDLESASQALENLSIEERFMQDPIGNTLSVLVLVGMLGSTGWLGMNALQPQRKLKIWAPAWVPVLVLVGVGVSTYMAFIEISGVEAVCGPVGDCNTVQSSPYAQLYGLIPIGILGMVGYLLVGLGWVLATYGPQKWKATSAQALWALAFFGTLFSIYLTFLEPFVIGATCAWCLTSAIVMTLLLWATTPLAMAQNQG